MNKKNLYKNLKETIINELTHPNKIPQEKRIEILKELGYVSLEEIMNLKKQASNNMKFKK